MYGAFIVNKKNDPLRALYDEEIPIILSDWFHADGVSLGTAVRVLKKHKTPARAPEEQSRADSFILHNSVPMSITGCHSLSLTVAVKPTVRMASMDSLAGASPSLRLSLSSNQACATASASLVRCLALDSSLPSPITC